MKAYVTKLLFEIHSGSEISQFDEQIRIFFADKVEEAYEKAVNLGKAEETWFLNGESKWVHWEFKGLSGIERFDKFRDGMQIGSRTIELQQWEKQGLLSQTSRERILTSADKY